MRCRPGRQVGNIGWTIRVGSTMTVVLLILAALLLSYANGANDNFKAVATV